MKPRDSQARSPQENLFQARLDQQLDPKHPLFRLAQQIDWNYFEQEFGSFYSEEMGRPGAPTRLLVGLHYLKHAYDESDESVVEKWVENPYWQYFCGYEFFQHEWPCHPTSLVKWRGGSKPMASRRCSRKFWRRPSAPARWRRKTFSASLLIRPCRRRRSPSRPTRGS